MTPLEHIMGLMGPSYSEPVRRSMAQSILDKHAHELAEQIRQRYGKPRWEGDEPEYAYGYNAATHDAADLIDPKAQRAATTGDNT
ncbi:hypothetical protein [Streptomyces sp. 1222.5]|uniref:hypothetical protein n=1 Tax=Streptomyces sp. 1222.5 TaxID=1881026 RepID=UPI003EB8C051